MEYEGEAKPRYVFVIGTLCKRLAKEYDFTHISVGDLVREAAKQDEGIRWHADNGKLLHTDYLFPILRQAFLECVSGRPIILDGFPRQPEQVWKFEKAFGEPQLVLLFQCPQEVAKDRVVNRKEGRPADTSEVFDKRYKEYSELNPAIVRHYGKSQGKDKLVEVDTSGVTDVSWEKLLKALQTREEWPQLVKVDSPLSLSPSP
ncbi:hypothetical protein C8A03DRAFT_11839 [Achaetomium macrosporum]|uniref:Adenylate kinase n=1 Tax=Achaetomium macrosporum TaxID=79813 RepID=A0AAN7CH41_9PEZI|nr:hypothetical protein C8A03DRAFT_11839 [Achaetomium macrosporum]